MFGEMRVNFIRLERLDAQAQMIQIATLDARRLSTGAAEFPGDGHEVDERAAGAQLVETDLHLVLLRRAAEHIDVEAQHALELHHPQHHMIDLADAEHAQDVKSRVKPGRSMPSSVL